LFEAPLKKYVVRRLKKIGDYSDQINIITTVPFQQTLLTRRGFAGLLGMTSGALLASQLITDRANAGSHSKKEDFKSDAWTLRIHGNYKQVFDITSANNSFGAAYPLNFISSILKSGRSNAQDITAVAVFRHWAMPMMLSSAAWGKYKIGEIVGVDDPKTNQPAERNIFSDSIPLHNISYNELISQDNVIVVACEMALDVISTSAANNTGTAFEKVKEELIAELIPGVYLSPSGVYAVNRAQKYGCTYCYTG
jgi:hypothetical protein